jgi:hypothetical protein
MASNGAGADQHDRMLGVLQDVGEGALAASKVAQRIRTGADVIIIIGEIGLGADHADLELTGAPALADARVENRGFLARVGADDQQRIGLVDADNGRVEDIGRATRLGIEGVSALHGEIA